MYSRSQFTRQHYKMSTLIRQSNVVSCTAAVKRKQEVETANNANANAIEIVQLLGKEKMICT